MSGSPIEIVPIEIVGEWLQNLTTGMSTAAAPALLYPRRSVTSVPGQPGATRQPRDLQQCIQGDDLQLPYPRPV